MSRLFGTDGVRGVAVTELTCETAMNIGRALAAFLRKKGSPDDTPAIIIGKDTRRSSDILEAALVAGILSAGADAELAGIVPTPAVAYFTKKYEASAGVMITASHNSAEFNGIKLFGGDGYKFSDAEEDEIEKAVLDPASIPLKNGRDVGRVSYRNSAVHDYTFELCGYADRKLDGLSVLIDCANGCVCVPAMEVFANLGADCVLINNSPDGMNVNLDCGSTCIEKMSKQVVEGNFNLGISFDGDGDRMLAVDERGSVVNGDKLIGLLATYMKQKGKLAKDTAVVTIMSNMGLHRYMENNGLKTVKVPVGDRYVIEKMRAENYVIGGEQSGHIIFSDYATTGDGMITAIKLLCLLKDRAVPLSTLAAMIPVFPQVLKNAAISPAKKGQWQTNPAVKAAIDEVKAAAGLDSRILIRESGTEPLLRVMIEGQDSAKINAWADKICETAKRELG